MDWLKRFLRGIGANRVVLALSTARMVDSMGNSILFILIPLYVGRLPSPWLHLPEPVLVGILISVYGLIVAFSQPLVGRLIDTVKRPKLIIQVGLVVMAAATFSFILAVRYVDLLVIRTIQGVGVALTVPASLALMAAGTERRTRGGAMGVFTTMRLVGFAIGPMLGGWLHDRFGFDTAFIVGAVLIAGGFALVQLLVREPPFEEEEAEAAGGKRFFSRELLTPAMLGLAFATFVMAASFTLMVPLEKEFNRRLQESALGFGIAFSALMVSRLFLQIPLGRLSDRIGRRPLLLVGLLLMAPTTALLGLAANTVQLALIRVFQGAASAGVAAPAFALAADLASKRGQGRQLGLVTMGFGLGIALGPLLAGFLAVVFFELPFLVGGVLSLIGTAVVWIWVHDPEEGAGEAGARMAAD